jgi:hypothetical protein
MHLNDPIIRWPRSLQMHHESRYPLPGSPIPDTLHGKGSSAIAHPSIFDAAATRVLRAV